MSSKTLCFEEWKSNLKKGRLMGLKCRSCKTVIFPPQIVCTNCSSRNFDLIELKGQGEIVTYTVIHVVPEGMENLSPIIVAIVRLEEGPMCVCRGVGIKLDEIKIGLRVKIGWETQSIYDEEDIILTCRRCD